MIKRVNLVAGGFLFFLGVAGFLPNPIIGSSGYFKTDAFHNFFHLACAAAFALLTYRKGKAAGQPLKIFGYFFILLSVAGFLLADNDRLFGILSANIPDNWLHLVLGIVFLLFADKLSRPVVPAEQNLT